MKRWIGRLAKGGMVCLALQTSIGLGQDALYETSPSDIPFRTAANRIAAPDDAYMRGLDDVTGTEDLVGSAIDSSAVHAPVGELPYVHPPYCACCVNEQPVSRFRNGFYQGSSISGGYLGDDDLGITHYDISTRFAVPIDGMDNVVIIAPSFRQEFLDVTAPVDVADELFVTGVNFTWLKKISDRWKFTGMITPSIRSDFQTSEEAFRLFGLALATYEWIPDHLDASIGVVYLDRDDIPILPAVGFTWTPKPWWRVDANFPRPRIARRIDKCGGESESWIYTGVALGGNTYAVERANGTDDVLTLRDYQWVFGWEHLRSGGRGMFVEGGAAFGRALEYENTGEEVEFDDSLFFRIGLTL